jgi:RNA polymerase sigma-70 factor (ECF subfamily)
MSVEAAVEDGVEAEVDVETRAGASAEKSAASPAQPVAVCGGPTFGDIFDAHAEFVGRALRCLGVSERDLADACQEVFLVAHARLAEFEGRSSIRTWLYAICVRRALTYKRTVARRREDAVAEPPEPALAATSASTPEGDVERARAVGMALEILDALDEEKRAVFALYEVEQLSMPEIAEVVGCPLQTAYSRLYAARREVARELVKRRARSGGERRR